jgi:GT2 family glycosyltransferase
MKENTIDVIIPTYDNPEQLTQCVSSLMSCSLAWPIRIIIVNNGNPNTQITLPEGVVDIKVVVPKGGNQGWTGGLIEGLKHSDSEFVLFANDDIFFPPASYKGLRNMVRLLLTDRSLAAVGPSSNCVMGLQNVWSPITTLLTYVPFLIGFCMLVKRSALDEVGGIDPSFNTGDDIDLSIRFRDGGYRLVADQSTFVYHHGFQTGVRVYGDHNQSNGWNSAEMTRKTNEALIRKHGFLKWWHTMVCVDKIEFSQSGEDKNDTEAEVVKSYLNGDDPSTILDIGCGPRLTVEGSVGLDMVSKGYENPYVPGSSVATITHDLNNGNMPIEDESYKTVIARHILEHCIDPVAVLKDIKRVLTIDGKAIIVLPDEKIGDTISMNPEHVHVFTLQSFLNMAESVGFRAMGAQEGYNGVSFTVLLEK